MAEHTFIAKPDSLEATTTYVFNAPREQVFKAFTDPALISKWWIEDAEIGVDTMDVKTGGSWRFVEKTANGDFVFRGVYHKVDAPKQLVTTWTFEAMPAVALETVTFEELPDNQTKVTDQFVFQSTHDREMMLTTGMSEGTVGMMDRLAELLPKGEGDE